VKTIVLIAAFIILIQVPGAGQTAAPRASAAGGDEQAVRELERRYAGAVARQDVAALKEILAEDFTAISSGAEIRDRTKELEDIKPADSSPASEFSMEGFDLDDINVRLLGDAAVVTGRSTLKVKYKGQSMTGLFRYTRVYAKRGGRWWAVSQQLTRVPQAQPKS
jgi:ketosteroid isomerase-like protein